MRFARDEGTSPAPAERGVGNAPWSRIALTKKHISLAVTAVLILANLFESSISVSQARAATEQEPKKQDSLKAQQFDLLRDHVGLETKRQLSEGEVALNSSRQDLIQAKQEQSLMKTKQDTNNGTWCFQHNSQTWLNGPRFNNTENVIGEGQRAADVRQMILNSPNLLANAHNAWGSATHGAGCHKSGSFVNAGTSDEVDHARRVFAAIHYHQHHLAIPEAQARAACSDQQLKDIGAFDYECPSAQYIVTSYGSAGLGANVRGGPAAILTLGLSTNRVAHIINNAQRIRPQKSHFKLFSPWELASCPRHDSQCVFMPLSPCVPTEQDITTAHVLNGTKIKMVRETGLLPDYLNSTKVVVWPQQKYRALWPIPEASERKAQEYISSILDPQAPPVNWTIEEGTEHRMPGAAVIYSLRLLPWAKKKMEEKVQSVGSPLRRVKPSHTIGLPIRASDKCKHESKCLTYLEHLQAATDFWNQQGGLSPSNTSISVIVTSESATVRHEHDSFAQQSLSNPHPIFNYAFLTNSFEQPPDTGNSRPFRQNNRKDAILDADEMMLGSMASLSLQLHAGMIVANRCSNYHVLLNAFAVSGCSARPDGPAKFFYLQQSANPWFRVCCFGRGKCKRERAAYRPPDRTEDLLDKWNASHHGVQVDTKEVPYQSSPSLNPTMATIATSSADAEEGKKKIRQDVSLVTSFFADGVLTLSKTTTTATANAQHLQEIAAAILKNIHNPYFAQVVVILDGARGEVNCSHFREYLEKMEKELLEWSHQQASTTILHDTNMHPQSLQKLTCVNREQGQPNYYEMFMYATNSNTTSKVVTSPIVVLENADHVFDETLHWAGLIKPNTLLTLPSNGYNKTLTPPEVTTYLQFANRNLSEALDWDTLRITNQCKTRVSLSWDGYIFHQDHVRGSLDPSAFERPTKKNTTAFFFMNDWGGENAALGSLLKNLPNDTYSSHGCCFIKTWHYHAAPKMHKTRGKRLRWVRPLYKSEPSLRPSHWTAEDAFVVDPKTNFM